MATEVLRPHDVLRGPFPAILSPPRRIPDSNPKACRKPTARTPAPRQERGRKHRERSPTPSVAILKRGERVQRPEEVYAGSGFCNSPEPSALPLPCSLVVRKGDDAAQAAATMNLRKMLGLH